MRESTTLAPDWRRHLSAQGEEEWAQLVSLLHDDAESFALYIVRSDMDTSTRDALLAELAKALAPVSLQTIALSREQYDAPLLLAQTHQEADDVAVFVVTGLEETPLLAYEHDDDDNQSARPPALALLNHGREAMRRIDRPVLLWCDPLAYGALREHAPDFFDHYTALFSFLDAAPTPLRALSISPALQTSFFDSDLMPEGRPRLMSAISPRATSPAARQFYEDQLEAFPDATPDRALALLGLANTLFSAYLPALKGADVERGEVAVREAIEIFDQLGMRSESARAHAMLAMLLKRKLRLLGVENPAFAPVVQGHIACALEVFNEEEFPVEWAALMWMQADDSFQSGQDEVALRRAIPFYQAAQKVYTPQSEPYFWASCEMNLGNIYTNLPFTPRNSKRAIEHLQNALRVYGERTQPQEFGLVQMLIGKAHAEAAKRAKSKDEQAKLLRRAIEHYEHARRGFERIQSPQHVALAFTMAALAWENMPTGNRRQHWRQCANCWLQAAELLARSEATEDKSQSALSLNQAGEALLQLGQLTRMSDEALQAREVFETARLAFGNLNDTANANRAAEIVGQIDQLLRETKTEIVS